MAETTTVTKAMIWQYLVKVHEAYLKRPVKRSMYTGEFWAALEDYVSEYGPESVEVPDDGS